jgi:hypothetical protein
MARDMALSPDLVRVAQELDRLTDHCCLDGMCARDLRRKVPKLLEAIIRLGEGKRQLNRAWEHLVGCNALYEMMFFSREVSLANYYEAVLRIEQLWNALSQMRDQPLTEWERVEVAPATRAPRPEDHPIIKTRLRERAETDKRVDETLRRTLPHLRPQPAPKAQPKIEVVEAPPGQKRPPPRWLN